MTKSELIKSYEELKSKLEIGLKASSKIKHRDSYKKNKTSLEILTLVIDDIKNLNGETVKREQVCSLRYSERHCNKYDPKGACLSCGWRKPD